MSKKIAFLPASSTMTAEQALDSMKHLEPKDVVVIAYDEDGDLLIRSSRLVRRDALWMLEVAKIHIMKEVYENA
jgi:L-ascorbate metabolism protein UlaG (beta-lactamase superfamily)